jgi:hypothetical protein
LSASLIHNDNLNKDSNPILSLPESVNVKKRYMKQSESMKKLQKMNSNENVKIIESPRDISEG